MRRLLRTIVQQQVFITVLGAALLAACSPQIEVGRRDGAFNQQEDLGPSDDASSVDMTLPHILLSIIVSPTNQLLEVDLQTATTQPFTAIGHYTDGAVEDLTQQVVWESSNLALGSFAGATLAIPALTMQSALVTQISAKLGNISGAAQLTVVAYRKTGDKTDFFFTLPFNDPVGAQQKPLDFKTDVRSLDVFFAVDTTGSMTGEIVNLQNTLVNTIVPGIKAQIPDTQFGVGFLEDFPVATYGNAHGTDCYTDPCDDFVWGGSPFSDQPFHLLQAITSTISLVQTAMGQLTTPTIPDTEQYCTIIAIGGWCIGTWKTYWSQCYSDPEPSLVPRGCGGDAPESTMEALYQIATGAGLPIAVANVPANHSGVGGVAFRQGTMPVVIPVTDVVFHAKGEAGACGTDPITYAAPVYAATHTRQETKNALNQICAKVVGVAAITGSCSPLNDEKDFATATGARIPPAAWQGANRPAACGTSPCCTGAGGAGRAADSNGLCPLVFEINTNGIGLDTSVVTGLKMLTRYAPFNVAATSVGESQGMGGEVLPSGTTTADFIKGIVPVSFQKPPAPPVLPDPVITANGFDNVTPGTVVVFTVEVLNDFVAQTTNAQLFRATIRVTAGGCTDLDERVVLILVPPAPIIVS